MRINTVRARLTLWNIAAMTVVLLLFSTGVYALSARLLLAQLEAELRSAAQITELALNHEIEEHGGREKGEANVREVLRTMHQTSFPRTAVAIWHNDRLVAQKPGLLGREAADIPHALRRQPGTRAFLQDGREYRILTAQAPVPFIGATYQVTVNESTEDMESDLANLRRALLLSVPLFVLLSAIGGYLMARKSLQPVADMAAAVERVSSANLNEHLPIANPRDEFGRLTETFNSLLDRLEQAFGNQQRFMADASHELRTPLSVALTAAQVTLKNPDRDRTELLDALSLIEEQLRRLKRIVEDMFVLAQADAGAYQPAVEPVYLNDIAEEALRAARMLARGKNIDLKDFRDGEDMNFRGDEGLLRQLMLILLDNAVKYTPEGGQVSLRLAQREDGYEIEVTDTGPGIPQADGNLIFERFYRSDKARSRRHAGAGSGAGLGLAIARWITGLHGGTISVSSSPDGATFRVRLPHPHARRPVAAS
ncbi:MAG TPA: ATP-binding protein [Bryobacteraceae bacterium]|nr:ATP-binding protein [Bryobacteraceae bacterium]